MDERNSRDSNGSGRQKAKAFQVIERVGLWIFILGLWGVVGLQSLEISRTQQEIVKRFLILETKLKTRAQYVNWRVEELGMAAGDAIALACAAHDMANPSKKVGKRSGKVRADVIGKSTTPEEYAQAVNSIKNSGWLDFEWGKDSTELR